MIVKLVLFLHWEAYGMRMLLDEPLMQQVKYIEAGDHQHLIGIDAKQYLNMQPRAILADISGHIIGP